MVRKVASNHIDKNDTSITYQSTVSYRNTVLSKKTGALELLAILTPNKMNPRNTLVKQTPHLRPQHNEAFFKNDVFDSAVG